jgi:hypothetical protein
VVVGVTEGVTVGIVVWDGRNAFVGVLEGVKVILNVAIGVEESTFTESEQHERIRLVIKMKNEKQDFFICRPFLWSIQTTTDTISPFHHFREMPGITEKHQNHGHLRIK